MKRRNINTVLMAYPLASILAVPVFAQQSTLLEEVIVVAQKREQSAQDVGIAVTAFSGNQLRSFGLKESTDIAAMTPGVHITGALGGQLSTFTIRGISQSDFVEIAESPNATYIDEAYVGFMSGASFAMYDLDRVEILKGPQGTLFGRNATGGLVHYLSHRPTDETEGFIDLTYGSYDQLRLEAALSGTLSDAVRGRVSLYHNEHKGVKENLYPGGDDEGNDNTQSVRAQLEINISDDSMLWLKADIGRSEIATAPYFSVPTWPYGADGHPIFAGDPSIVVDTRDGEFDFMGGTGSGSSPESRRVTQDFSKDDLNIYESNAFTAIYTLEMEGGATLTSVTDYREYEKETYFDNDAEIFSMLNFFSQAENEQFSQEIRLNGATETTIWSVGGYFLTYETDVDTGVFADESSISGLTSVWLQNTPELDTTSYSLFGQIERDLTEKVSLIGGARVIKEEKSYSHAIAWYDYNNDNDNPGSTGDLWIGNPGVPPTEESTDDTLWSGKIQLEWRPTDELLIYGGINRGVKAGSFNQDLGGLGLFDGKIYGVHIPPSYDDEELIAYEIGLKSSFMNGMARLNGAVFYYDYKDFQAFRYSGLNFYVTNQDAHSTGVELDVAISPVNGLDIGLSAAYIDMTVENITFDAGVRDVEPPYTPQVQATALVRYGWDALNGRISVQANASYSGSFYSSATNFTSTEFPSYTLVDMRVSYDSGNGNWELAVFGKNITDEFYKTVGFDVSRTFGLSQYSQGAPAWYGVSVRYHF